jgi:glucose/arabinose dehydrogenase
MQKKILKTAGCVLLALAGISCHQQSSKTPVADSAAAQANVPGDTLPAPDTSKSVKNFSHVVGWPGNSAPTAPAGFTVTKFADGFKNPRWIYVAPDGDIFVSEGNAKKAFTQKVGDVVSGKAASGNEQRSADRITLLRDTNGDGKPDQRYTFLEKLDQPFGMLILGDKFYVGNTNGLMQYPYKKGDNKITAAGKSILSLPAGGYNNHWTRNVIAAPDGAKLYVSVGSGSNVGEHGMENEARRANILQINPDGSGEKVFASGLRNPVGMDWAPGTQKLWTVVNERDELGDELVPDYLTSVKEGGFYGWPYAYFGQHEDPRRKGEQPDLVKKAIVPDFPLGAHTASLGLVFYKGKTFPAKYQQGAFIGQHGSWNRSQLAGYKVLFVPFSNGQPSGPAEDFLTGFIADMSASDVHGRPVGVAVAADGALLVADDASNTVWRVAAQ